MEGHLTPTDFSQPRNLLGLTYFQSDFKFNKVQKQSKSELDEGLIWICCLSPNLDTNCPVPLVFLSGKSDYFSAQKNLVNLDLAGLSIQSR